MSRAEAECVNVLLDELLGPAVDEVDAQSLACALMVLAEGAWARLGDRWCGVLVSERIDEMAEEGDVERRWFRPVETLRARNGEL